MSSENQQQGKIFETLFFKQAQRLGITVIKNHQACRVIFKGRVQLIKGELDFKLITQNGRVGYFDCKTYSENYFTYSEIDKDQLERSILYNELNAPSGFVVWFRPENKILFYSGKSIQKLGPRSRFDSSNGILLGRFEQFNLNMIIK